jgi:hypothetical protein
MPDLPESWEYFQWPFWERGPQNSDQFFIGNKEEDGWVVAVGGENRGGVSILEKNSSSIILTLQHPI